MALHEGALVGAARHRGPHLVLVEIHNQIARRELVSASSSGKPAGTEVEQARGADSAEPQLPDRARAHYAHACCQLFRARPVEGAVASSLRRALRTHGLACDGDGVARVSEGVL